MYLRKSKSTTPGNHGNLTVFIGHISYVTYDKMKFFRLFKCHFTTGKDVGPIG